MATNLAIDPKLLEEALKLSGEKTKTAAVTLALEEFIARRNQKRLRELFGKFEWDPDYDYKAERGRDEKLEPFFKRGGFSLIRASGRWSCGVTCRPIILRSDSWTRRSNMRPW